MCFPSVMNSKIRKIIAADPYRIVVKKNGSINCRAFAITGNINPQAVTARRLHLICVTGETQQFRWR
ncbi:hypothetical protein BCSJ1_13865 [Bacillus cereus SJ1]|nr:hypothetical protein BCSJ1_13865 [Bacillus cereus SJ1]